MDIIVVFPALEAMDRCSSFAVSPIDETRVIAAGFGLS
jgi:hypothetical protein